MKRLITFLLIFIISGSFVLAQYNVHWRKIRHEVSIGGGTNNFLGELGGSKTVGSHFVKDFDFYSSRWQFQAGYSYKLSESWAISTNLIYGRLYGSDELSGEENRYNRNISFRSPFVDLSANIQFSIMKERYGHRYDLKRVKGAGNIPNLYIFTGISGMYFNPKGQYTDGKWYALQPLGTEGQGIIPTREKYSRIAFGIPLGIGINYMIDRNFGIGAEYAVKYYFTDYIDDVSSTYVDPEIFTDPIAAYFSSGTANPGWRGTGPGQQRGQTNYNDAYMYLTVKLTYKLRPGLPGMPKF
ncbi:MAG: hypothetical protein GX793_07325 [Bacteroidales bacterium]|nr:hypothetical protein [Bacteroidales bacterium]